MLFCVGMQYPPLFILGTLHFHNTAISNRSLHAEGYLSKLHFDEFVQN